MSGRVNGGTKIFLAANAAGVLLNLPFVACEGSWFNAFALAVGGLAIVVCTGSAARQAWPDAPPSREGI